MNNAQQVDLDVLCAFVRRVDIFLSYFFLWVSKKSATRLERKEEEKNSMKWNWLNDLNSYNILINWTWMGLKYGWIEFSYQFDFKSLVKSSNQTQAKSWKEKIIFIARLPRKKKVWSKQKIVFTIWRHSTHLDLYYLE